jgi:hypothetical protein
MGEIRYLRPSPVRLFVYDVAEDASPGHRLMELLLFNRTYNASVFVMSSGVAARMNEIRANVDHLVFRDARRIFNFCKGSMVSVGQDNMVTSVDGMSDSEDSGSDDLTRPGTPTQGSPRRHHAE